MVSAARRDDLVQLDGTWRWVLASLSLGGAFVHFAVMGGHFDESTEHGLFFAVVAWGQLAFALGILLRPSRWLLCGGVIANAAIVVAWIVSRTVGVPFGADPWTPEPAAFPDILATVFESLIVAGGLVLLTAGARVRKPPAAVALPFAGALGAAVLILSTISLIPAVAGDIHGHGDARAAADQHEVTVGGGGVDPEALSDAPHGHAAGIESGNGTSPCEESGPPVSNAQAAGGHGERGPSPQEPIDDAAIRELLGGQLELARAAAAKFPTAADARDAGYIRITPYLPCIGAHWIKPSLMDDTFDVNEPEMLLYDRSGPDGEMVGLSYWARTGKNDPPEGFAGSNDLWHQHIGLCVSDEGVVGNEETTKEECAERGGQKTDGSDSWMVHAWVVPGWESAWGLFSGEHPELGVNVPHTTD